MLQGALYGTEEASGSRYGFQGRGSVFLRFNPWAGQGWQPVAMFRFLPPCVDRPPRDHPPMNHQLLAEPLGGPGSGAGRANALAAVAAEDGSADDGDISPVLGEGEDATGIIPVTTGTTSDATSMSYQISVQRTRSSLVISLSRGNESGTSCESKAGKQCLKGSRGRANKL